MPGDRNKIEANESQSGGPVHDLFIQNMYRFINGNYHKNANLKGDDFIAIAYNMAFVTYYENHKKHFKKYLEEGGEKFYNDHLKKYWQIMKAYTDYYYKKNSNSSWWGALYPGFADQGLEMAKNVIKYVDDYFASNGGGGTNQNIFTGVAEYMKRAVYAGKIKLNNDGEITGDTFHPVPAVMYAIFVIQSLMYFISYAKRLFYIIALSLFAPVVIIYDFFIKSVSG